MTKRMLIDATYAEETRVVVLDGSRLEDFDVETATKKQLKGNIYLAKVVRVEPSLQAAFVEYGGNRHGFLAFDEIHPDYYQIPVADRQRLIEMQAEDARREEEAEDRAAESESNAAVEAPAVPSENAAPDTAMDVAWHEPAIEGPQTAVEPITESGQSQPPEFDTATAESEHSPAQPAAVAVEAIAASAEDDAPAEPAPPAAQSAYEAAAVEPFVAATEVHAADVADAADPEVVEAGQETWSAGDQIPEQPPPETMGGDDNAGEDARARHTQSRFLRNYKIQEVIRRRQILLVQVVKEERGTKGAALTTYISLAGRFCVLMPNSPRGGGISRKITSVTDRRRLKDIIAELDIPKGMGLIVRTAGANRPKPEIRRDCEYLLRLWDDIREHTLKSVAPALIYEEASLIKRAIRDVYSRDIDEIQVDGEEGWRAAHEFMRMLMPSHAKKVQLWRDSSVSNGGVSNGGGQPLFAKYSVEAQLDGMLQPIVQLRSGGYLVINQTEALVAIDVNSGRSTRERGIEETALRTNLEAADEVARQLRLRDLAGLIVIDFIDMEAKKHNAMVERRLKEALKNDRARIQVGHISHFGLMEMSRQRLRPSLAETSFIACPHCGGTGHVRSTESAAIHVLRGVEEEGAKRRAAEIVVYASVPVALYILNHKRERLAEIEARYAMQVICLGDEAQMTSQFRIDRLKPQVPGDAAAVITQDMHPPGLPAPMAEADEAEAEEPDVIMAEPVEVEPAAEADDSEEPGGAAHSEVGETAEEAERRHRRRRRRRRGGHRDDAAPAAVSEPPGAGVAVGSVVEAAEDVAAEAHIEGVPEHAEAAAEDESRGRRRGRRGGRRRRPDGTDADMPLHSEPGADQPDLPPVYSGPTPADPFGGHAFDIFDVLDRVESTAVAPPHAAIAEPAVESEPEPTPVAVVEQASAPAETSIAEPVTEPLPEPVPELVAIGSNEPEPAIRPIVIGNGEAPVVEKKRGWWRR